MKGGINMNRNQLKTIATIIRHFLKNNGGIRFTHFDFLGDRQGEKLFSWSRKRQPRIFLAFYVPSHPRLKEFECDAHNYVIGPQGGVLNHEVRFLRGFAYNEV